MKLERPLLRLPRQYDAAKLSEEIAALPQTAWLPHPGRLVGNDAVPLITPKGQITDAFDGEMAATEHLKACPYIQEIMADLDGVWGRSRLMGLVPGADVPAHVDSGYYWRTHLRIHIPIITSPKVAFTCGGETVHMAAGECWVFDSFRMHNVRNGGTEKRIHLVLDTVGGERLWDLVQQASAGDAEPQFVAPGTVYTSAISYERVNLPETMSPWEVRCHIDYIFGQAQPGPRLDAASSRIERFANGWAAAWARYGNDKAGQPLFRELLNNVRDDLRKLGSERILLVNDLPLDKALHELIFLVAVPAPAIAIAGGRDLLAAAR